jgi:hypothetical protein
MALVFPTGDAAIGNYVRNFTEDHPGVKIFQGARRADFAKAREGRYGTVFSGRFPTDGCTTHT